jgi:fatty acid desaturase
MKPKLFAHSRLDAILVLVALVQLAVVLHGVLSFGTVSHSHSLITGLCAIFLMCTNFECVAHSFIHHPFFQSRRLNGAFGVFNSLLLGGPQTLYRFHHLHHHKYNNDAPDLETGTTEDLSSTWRFSRWAGHEEGFLSYALLGYFRFDVGVFLRAAKKRHLLGQVIAETAAWLALLVVVGFVNPLGLVCFYVPVWYLGNAAAQGQTYLEHYGAIPGNRKTDSVSSYGVLYNLIWFNHGYHQEHHYRPQIHWTRIPEVKPLLPPESQRRVVPLAHWFNFGAVGPAGTRGSSHEMGVPQ